MSKFVYAPYVVDAVQFTADGNSGKPGFANPPDWLKEALENQSSPGGYVSIHNAGNADYAIFRNDSVNGLLEGKVGDWLVREAPGRFFVREDSAFRGKYISVEDFAAAAEGTEAGDKVDDADDADSGETPTT